MRRLSRKSKNKDIMRSYSPVFIANTGWMLYTDSCQTSLKEDVLFAQYFPGIFQNAEIEQGGD